MRGILGFLFYSSITLAPVLIAVSVAGQFLHRDRFIALARVAVVIGFLAGGDVDGVVPLREVDPERPGPLQGFDLIVRRGPDGGVRQEQHPKPSGAVEIGRGEAETVAAVRTLAQSALDGEALKRVAGRKGRRPDEVDAVELAA